MRKPMMPGRETQVRFFKFLSVGGLAAVVQFVSLKLFSLSLGADLSFSLSFCCSTTTHYLMNRFWALPSERQDNLKQFVEYLGTAVLSYIINLGLFKLCHNLLGFGLMPSAIIALPPSTLVVFLLLNYRVFSKKAKS